MGKKIQSTCESTALDRFLSGINESVFQTSLGIANIELINYLNDLLIRFVRIDIMRSSGICEGAPSVQIFQLLNKAEKSRGPEQRSLYQAIGDYTLFWSGMYPESLRRSRGKDCPDSLLDYTSQGKRSYAMASRIDRTAQQPTKQVLQCLSKQYDLCVFGLGEVRREWEQHCNDQSGNLIA